MSWQLSCLLCGEEDTNLVRIQEHAMTVHGATPEDLHDQHRRGPILLILVRTRRPALMYQWTLPDGREWLRAIEAEEEPHGGDLGPHA